MRILVRRGPEPEVDIRLPDFLLTSTTLYRLGLFLGKRYAGNGMPDISPESLKKISAALKDAKRKYGSFELVHVESSQGEDVTIWL